jgi:hypothetical protein
LPGATITHQTHLTGMPLMASGTGTATAQVDGLPGSEEDSRITGGRRRDDPDPAAPGTAGTQLPRSPNRAR